MSSIMISLLIKLSAAFVFVSIISYIKVLHVYLRKAKINVPMVPNKKKRCFSQAPGPLPLPIIGNLHLLRKYEVPFQAFTELSERYGTIYSLTLGSTRCVVVSNLELIREVLNENGKFFGGRPDFLRYHKLFGGDRNNSLALCDWSTLQQKRRNLARRHCSPRDSSILYSRMSDVGCHETLEMMKIIRRNVNSGREFELKPLIQQTCANMFIQYMCSLRFNYEDDEFQQIVKSFDEIFWEINQGYAVDFLPWLAPFYKQHFKTIVQWSTSIRKFILERIINSKEKKFELDHPQKDFTDALLVGLSQERNVSRSTIIFMLEDFIGGHSAVGNLVMLALIYIAKFPHVGKRIQSEVDNVSQFGKRKINLYDKEAMPYTMATILEVLRFSSSPIVPHVATEDVVVGGYGILAGTIVFINNYKLNKSDEYWVDARLFDPQRFLEEVNEKDPTKLSLKKNKSKVRKSESFDPELKQGYDSFANFQRQTLSISSGERNAGNRDKVRLKKRVPHFLPFSIGKRTCIGQKLVQGFGFILLANILQEFDIHSKDLSSLKIKPACVALPAKTFCLNLFERRRTEY